MLMVLQPFTLDAGVRGLLYSFLRIRVKTRRDPWDEVGVQSVAGTSRQAES